jgi:SAM-dependent methyltransferase
MKLSSLIVYKTILEGMTPLDTAPLAHDQLAPVLHTVKTNDLQFSNLTERLEQQYAQVLDCLCDFDQTLVEIKENISVMVSQHEPAYYAKSTDLYQQMCMHDSVDHILNRSYGITEENRQFLAARIQAHGDWQHAGLIIRPGREDWINLLVGCDPLYLVDTDIKLLDPAVLRFNDQYQRRLRTYAVSESVDAPILKDLPSEQFGFCLVYYFFNFKPIEIIRAYMAEIYTKLKPGGTFAMTFNDCDRSGGVDLAERGFACYTPAHAVLSAAADVGFELHQSFKIDAANTWLEFRRPGKLTSLRGGQTLATVMPKTNT